MKTSAYVCLFDDWELLDTALAAIEPHVDEIVIVDGAYRWIAELIERTGRDASRSVDPVYQILRRFEPKLRVVTGIWENELQKRMAGYQACTHRTIYRVDADEVLFIDQAQLERFLASNHAVGDMEMPIYMAPGLIRATSADSPIERQALLFDRSIISARAHLDYLWLLLPLDEEATRRPPDPALIHPEPVAFNAHLTHWRSPATSINRARFYVINYIRGTGDIAWLSAFRRTLDEPYEAVLARFEPQVADDFLLGHPIVAQPPDLEGFILRPSPLSHEQERHFVHHYDALLGGLATINARLIIDKRHIVCGNPYSIDLSTRAAIAPFMRHGRFRIDFELPIAAGRAGLTTVDERGNVAARELSVDIDGASFALDIEPNPMSLRQTLTFAVWNQDGSGLNRFWTL